VAPRRPPARPVARVLAVEDEGEDEEVVDWKRICWRGRVDRRMGLAVKAVRPNWRDASLDDIVTVVMKGFGVFSVRMDGMKNWIEKMEFSTFCLVLPFSHSGGALLSGTVTTS
jgi:hypothetical protein